MRKIFFLVAFLSASIMSYADKVYDVNFALASEGSSATASSGNAGAAIDGDNGSRWESAQTDDETWTLDMGQARTFSRIKINWEGAYAKEFTLSISNDGESWSSLYVETNLSQAGWQTIDVAETTARYIQYHGTLRATGYGQSFWEFQVLLPGVSVLTKIELSAPAVAKVAEGVNLVARALDQNNAEMSVALSYEITPADAGAVVDGKYVPAKVGNASIVAKSGTVSSPAIEIFGYEGSNLALSTNIVTDNKIVAQSEFAPNGTDAFHAVDGNDGSVWQGSATNGTAGDEASRTFDAWFVVDLGANYSIDLITIHFEGACAQDYHVDFSLDNNTWATGYNYVGTAGINGRTDMLSAAQLDNNSKVRYVRFWSTKAGTEWGMKMFEFQVFGREYTAPDDHEKPVMVSASLVSNNHNSAVIAVSATDNDEVAKYHVVDLSQSFDAKFAATDGKITVTGLTPNTAYFFLIYAIDAANNESELSKSVSVTTDAYSTSPVAAAPVPEWPAAQVKAIYSDAYAFAPASLNSYNESWWDNPNMSEEAIGEDHYLNYDLYRNGMIGAQFAETSVATMEKFHIDVFASASGSVTFRLICAGDAEAINQTKQTLQLVGGQWNSFDFDLADFNASHNWTRFFQYAIEAYQAGGLVGEHICVDNMYFYRTTELVDTEAPTNVQGSVAAAGYFSVTLALQADDNMGVVNFSVKDGETIVATGAGAAGATVNVVVPNLQANTEYTFSIVAKDEKGNATEAITVSAKTLEAPAPATLPTYDAANVQGVYTDNYTDVAMGIQGWYAEPAISAGLLAENREALCITPNTTPSSCFGLAFPATDITAYTVMEMDVYPMAENAVLEIQVIGVGDASKTYNLTANQWNHISLNITGNEKTDCEQIGFYNCQNLLGVCFVQNVLFATVDTSDIENVQKDNVQGTKVLRDGQLYLKYEGRMYDVRGVRVE